MDIKALKKLANTYEYGQFNILDGNFSVKYDPNTESFEFKNFYHREKPDNRGTCAELMLQSCNDIKLLFPELYVTRVLGQDGKFFRDDDSPHYFNILTEYNPFKEQISTLEDLVKRFEKDAVAFDACFHMAKKFSQTQHKITMVYEQEFPLEHAIDLNLGDDGVTPLMYDYKNDTLIGLHSYHKYPSKIGLYFNSVDEQELIDINSPFLNMINNENITKFVTVLRNKVNNINEG
jgi:hypothetical protein